MTNDRGLMKKELLSAEARMTVLLAEYSAMYDLALFRLHSLDRRVPLTGSALVASLGATLVLPIEAQVFILVAVPLALVWFLRTTINHARSFEDALRRIEQIESKLNALAGDELVHFQSRHPSRGKATGGRTGRETITTVLIAGGLCHAVCPCGSSAAGQRRAPVLLRVHRVVPARGHAAAGPLPLWIRFKTVIACDWPPALCN